MIVNVDNDAYNLLGFQANIETKVCSTSILSIVNFASGRILLFTVYYTIIRQFIFVHPY